jgi:aminopeptidase N
MKHLFLLIFLFFSCFVFSQQTETVDYKTVKTDIVFGDLTTKQVLGFVIYEFEILKDVDSVYLDAKNMMFSNVVLSGLGVYADVEYADVKYDNDTNRLVVFNKFESKKMYELRFDYSVQPQKAMYFIDWNYEEGNKQVWTQGQGKYTSNWLPSIDDMNDKIEFDLTITFDKEYEVIANGKLTNKQINESTTTWHYDMQKPMSSYLVALAIGKYRKKVEYSKSGIPLEMYYYPDPDSYRDLNFEPTYRYTKQIFDFLEEEIGVPYPWQNYKMVPVKDFLYAGMENTSLNIFSDAFVVDSIAFVDKNFVNINAHELAHQWFGDLVTETSGTHHWLQEGFATYYALLAEKEVFGEDYYYWRLYEYAQELLEQDIAGQSTSLLDSKSSSATFYKKGAWVLHLLRKKVGDTAFKNAIKNYLEKHQFKNVETDDFISEVEKTSRVDLKKFTKDYLHANDNSFLERENQLIRLKYGLVILRCGMENIDKLRVKHNAINIKRLSDSISSKTKVNIIKDLLQDSIVDSNMVYKKAFYIKDILLRQALAQTLTEIPSELKSEYESLLKDKSYITIETALFNLWKNFPQERNKYLNQTKGIQGFNNKNIRILWLTLALITEGFEPENNTQYFEELTGYTSDSYCFEIRINAFRYLSQIQACNEVCKENLEQATTHHSWQFSKFAKETLKQIK